MHAFILMCVVATSVALPSSERCGLIRAGARAALVGRQEAGRLGRSDADLAAGCDANADGVIQDTELPFCYERFLFNPFSIQLILPFLWIGCGTTTTTATDTDGDGDTDVARMERRTLEAVRAAVRNFKNN